MGLVVAFSLKELDGCKQWTLNDTTGAYDATINPGGWGAPNPPAATGDKLVTFLVLQNGFTTGYLFTITIGNSLISDFTVTAPDGTVVNWFDWLNTESPTGATSFIAFTTAPFYIIPEMLGLTADDTFVFSAYYFEENITISEITYTASADQLITCAVCCCVTNMAADLEDCGCKDDKDLENAVRARMWLDSAQIAMNDQDVPKAQDLIVAANKLCKDGCAGCK